MRKILLPPLLMVLCIIGMYAVMKSGSATFWHTGEWNMVGYALLVIGAALPIWGSRAFKRHKTNILPYKDPDNIVTDGPFKFTRNPMYLGMLTALLGVDVLTGTFEGLAFAALYFAIANWWYIPYEESRMQAIFGDTFEVYKGKVRRWA